jgi:hypothetical protein
MTEQKQYPQTRQSGRCDSCEALMINGVYCHETGCRRSPVECRECGTHFDPVEHGRYPYCPDCREIHSGDE